jgi:large subunit ribosomal protein L13e
MRQIKVVITKQNGKQSVGKGFSPTELEKAGVDKRQARRIGLPVDIKRKSLHDENVETIKVQAEKAKAESKSKEPEIQAEPKEKPKKKAKK